MDTRPIDFCLIEQTFSAYANYLEASVHSLHQVLSSYQSFATTVDEIERSAACLRSVSDIKDYLVRRTGKVAVFFPLNLPVYSLVLFAIVPSIIADEVYLRPPQKMTPIFTQLAPLLKLDHFFPNVHVAYDNRTEFVERYVAEADVTIFTGKESNARNVLAKTKKDSLFLFNGWGCNPIVVGADADIDLAVRKVVEVKTFNSGQDCAGPDNILVHADIADEFIKRLEQRVNAVKVGDYCNASVTVGKIAEPTAMVHLSSFLQKHADSIIHGGMIDFAKSIVHPTIIQAALLERTNYEEFFSPIFFVNTFTNDSELATYFEDSRYKANEMYVSLFGSSEYVSRQLTNSIVYREQTIIDVESGNSAYGGYSCGASFVATGGKIEPRPILVPKEIFRFLRAGARSSELRHKLTAGKQKKILKDVSAAIKSHFGTNLVFGFVFGSVARGTAKEGSDVDTMVVIDSDNYTQKEGFLSWLQNYVPSQGLLYDEAYPSEIVTLQKLNAAVASLPDLVVNVAGTNIDQEAFDAQVWADVLSGTKRGIAGDEALMHQYARMVGGYPKRWKSAVITELETSPRFEVDVQALKKLSPDAVMKVVQETFWQHLE